MRQRIGVVAGRTMLIAWLLAALSGAAGAQQARLLVQSSPLAGFRYHEAKDVFPMMKSGDALSLVREPDNAYDANAVRVEWQGHKLGYVPRRENPALAWAMDRGQAVTARISRLQPHRNPRQRIEFEVFIE
ncbi:MAG: HIRAN protein [Betaproteobacteria bacterium]|nr:HIRAN protein [Betaproteobacteria bacterium]